MKKLLFFVSLFLCFPAWADVLSYREEFFQNLEYNYHIHPILFTMFLTAIIETVLLWCCKYRGWKLLTYFFVLNLISNLLINVVYEGIWQMVPYYVLVPILELGVVLFEAGLLGLMTKYNKKLWLSVFFTNLVSYSLGLLLFGL